jgi:hypothetical protein
MRKLRLGGVIAALVVALVCVPGALSAPPSNDNFGSPTVLTGVEGSHTTTNAEATKETGEPNHAGDLGGTSVWFSWTAPRGGVLLIDTCDSSFDTLLAVYTGTAVNALSQVDASDDSDGCGAGSETRSSLAIDVVSGTEYRIAVDGFDRATGSVVLWFAMTPINDDFAHALEIAGDYGSSVGTLRWATHELPEPLHAGSAGAGSVWYRWSPPGDLRASVRACAASNTLVAIYAGAELVSLTQVAAGETLCSTASYVDFDAFAGSTYRIAVDSNDPLDTFTLEWRTTPLLPRNVSPPSTSGSARTNEVLVASPGGWVNATEFSYVWFSCPDSSSTAACTTIRRLGPRPEELRIPTSVFGRWVRVQVYARGPHGVSSAWSAPSIVTAGPPVNLEAPEIEGQSVVGRRVTATEGAWDLGGGTRVSVTYRWRLCNDLGENCRDVKGPSSDNSYLVSAAARGRLISVEVTMTTNAGSTSALGAALDLVRRPAGAALCRVPRVVGRTLRAARKSLTRSHCRLGKVQRARSARKAGVIFAQTPRPGTRLRAGGRVNVRISLGRRR